MITAIGTAIGIIILAGAGTAGILTVLALWAAPKD